MNYKKKFTAIQISSYNGRDDERMIDLSYGRIEGPYYSKKYPQEEFDSEEDAIEYAFKKNQYATWMIVPIIKFD